MSQQLNEKTVKEALKACLRTFRAIRLQHPDLTIEVCGEEFLEYVQRELKRRRIDDGYSINALGYDETKWKEIHQQDEKFAKIPPQTRRDIFDSFEKRLLNSELFRLFLQTGEYTVPCLEPPPAEEPVKPAKGKNSSGKQKKPSASV